MESRTSGNPDIGHDQGRPRPVTIGRRRRYATIVFIACAAVLSLAAWLTPADRGYGTHRQLGFGKCGMLVTTGLPCPTCGMTTAFAYTVRGRFIRAFMAQPAGFLLALATIVTGLGSVWVIVTGRMPPIRIPILTPYRLFTILLVVLVGAWAFKIAVGLANGTLPDPG